MTRILAAALLLAPPAHAEEAPRARRVINLTQGLRFEPPFQSMAISPTNPQVAYLGTAWGFIYSTRDGGLSWSEQRALVSRGSFVGAIRPGSTVAPPGFSAPGGALQPKPSDVGDLPDEEDPNDALIRFTDPSELPGTLFNHGLAPTESGGGGGGGGKGARLGVGLRAGSPYLTLALRKKRGWAIGINMKQTLALKAAPPTHINWLDIHPQDPNVAFAATRSGLLRTTDGGASWPIVFAGSSEWERWTEHVVRSPHDPRLMYLSTAQGLRSSTDGGESWAPVTDSRLAQFHCRWVTFHPTDPKILYVGTKDGMFLSRDGGENYDWVFVRSWPAQNIVSKIAVDPADKNRVILATDDGLFLTEDGGETFERTGGLLFTGEIIYALSSSGRPGHFLVAVKTDLWETTDGGKSWRVVYFGQTQWDVRTAFFAPGDAGTVWLVTSAEILKLTEAPLERVPPDVKRRFLALVRGEPSAGQAVRAALARNDLTLADHLEHRRWARWRGLVPTVVAGLRAGNIDLDYRREKIDRPESPLANRGTLGGLAYGAHARWDLRELVYTQDEVPIDRFFRTARAAEWAVRQTVIQLYLERRRIQLQALLEEDAEPRTRIMRSLRLEELTAHLNALTGDRFEPVSAL